MTTTRPAPSRRPGTTAGEEGNDPRTAAPMDPAVAAYIRAIPPEYHALFDRIHQLILGTCPDATVVLSYHLAVTRAGPAALTQPRHAPDLHPPPAYGPGALRNDLDRFTSLLGGNDGEFLLGEDPPQYETARQRGHCLRTKPDQPPSAARTARR